MPCGTKVAGALLAILMLIAAPVAAQAVDVYRTPFIPVPPPEATPGTVVIQTSVFDGLVWATDQTIVLAEPTLTVSCGETTPEGAS